MIEEKIISLISEHPDIDTRIIIDAFAIAFDVPKQKISGHLSDLVQKDKITITTIKEGKESRARIK